MESITLQVGSSVVGSGDKVGQLQFAASSESDGGAATFVVGQIYAQAEGAFNTVSNPASIVFSTSAADNLPASGKIKISPDGNVLPLVDDTYTVGSELYRFLEVHCATNFVDVIEFDTTAGVTTTAGQLAWEDTYGTLSLGFTDTYSLHLGQETHFRVRNETGSTVYKGQAVAATGVHNDKIRLEISPYVADGSVREIRFIGLVTEDIDNNGSGYTTSLGYIRGNATYTLDTRGNVASPIAVGDETWAEGDILYVHPTVAGKLTNVEPKHSISVAIITRLHQTEGVILVRPTSYGHLADNHDVDTSGVANNDFLSYNSNTENWEPTSTGIFDSVGIGTTPTAQFHIKNENTTDKLLLESVDGGATKEEYIFNLQTSGAYYEGIAIESGDTLTDESGNPLFGDTAFGDFDSITFPLNGLATRVDCSLVGYNTTDNGSAGWHIKSMVNNTPSLAFVGTESRDSFVGPDMSGVNVELSLDDPDSLNVVVTGIPTVTINWAGTITLTNVH